MQNLSGTRSVHPQDWDEYAFAKALQVQNPGILRVEYTLKNKIFWKAYITLFNEPIDQINIPYGWNIVAREEGIFFENAFGRKYQLLGTQTKIKGSPLILKANVFSVENIPIEKMPQLIRALNQSVLHLDETGLYMYKYSGRGLMDMECINLPYGWTLSEEKGNYFFFNGEQKISLEIREIKF